MRKHTPVPPLSPEVALAQHLRAHLTTFLLPLLSRLTVDRDVRLVQTAAQCVEALIRLAAAAHQPLRSWCTAKRVGVKRWRTS